MRNINICYHRSSCSSSFFLPLPHLTIPEPKGHDLDLINVTHTHLIHSHWDQLYPLLPNLTPFTLTHILLKLQFNHSLSFQFYNFIHKHKPISLTLQTHSILLHILTKARNFKTAQSFLINNIITSHSLHFPSNLFDALLYSYRLCHSSPLVFDSLFKTLAHLKKLRVL
ncbi:hypothetical protein Lal_00041808 [Lupinus albus]|nr:hypothetical protein Lal_00041808 [Lupinus albus]